MAGLGSRGAVMISTTRQFGTLAQGDLPGETIGGWDRLKRAKVTRSIDVVVEAFFESTECGYIGARL